MRTDVPAGYWGQAHYHYFRDHAGGGWGVGEWGRRTPVVVGLDKNAAAALACLLNGDVDLARLYLDGLPDKLPPARQS